MKYQGYENSPVFGSCTVLDINNPTIDVTNTKIYIQILVSHLVENINPLDVRFARP